MTVFVAFLRAVNVGGTGMLPMKDLAALCTSLGLQDVRTYIQSGNVVFASRLSERKVQAQLEEKLAAGIAATLGLWSFSGVMIVLNVSAFLVAPEPRECATAASQPGLALRGAT